MKKRRPSSRVDPRDQFSKKLARWSSWFWFLYMLLTLAAVVIQPLSADAAVYLAGFSSVVMVLNIAAYTHNSVYDKAIAAGAKIVGRFHFSWKEGNTPVPSDADDPECDESMELAEEADPELSFDNVRVNE